MFEDIHTHNSVDSGYQAIRNLTFSEACNILNTEKKGLFSVGFHPWQACEFSTGLMDQLKYWSNDKRLVAIGECGLDKNSIASLDIQKQVFELQIELSENSQKPLIIHCVGCFNELFELKKKYQPHQLWIIHGFRGKPDLAKQAIHSGCRLSFGEHFNTESLLVTPNNQMFVETDDSKLSIQEIYHSISIIKNCKVEDLNAGENLIKSFRSSLTGI